MQNWKVTPDWKLKLAALLLSGVVALGLFLIAGNFITIKGETLNRRLCLKIWFTRVKYFGKPKIGIAEADPVIGWRHKPMAVGRHYIPYSFDVQYHIDEHGNRVTRAGYDLPKILFLGCSYTFGHGVADDSCYVAILQQQMPDYKLVNAAVNAYSTGQSYLTLLKSLARYKDIRLVIYPFINHHMHRNYLRKGWLEEISRQNVHFEVENGRLVWKGLAHRTKDAVSDSLVLEKKEAEISFALGKAMRDTCAALGIPFLLIRLPDRRMNAFDSIIKPLVDSSRYLDLQKTIDLYNYELPMDGHPNPAGHRLMAQQIFPFLEKHLVQPPPVPSMNGTKVKFDILEE